MKQRLLARAMSVAFATIALAACGSSDDDIQVGTTPTVTPNPSAPINPDVGVNDKLASIIANAKAMGLLEENAKKFAESVKDLEIGTDSYNTALAAALATQQAEIADASQPVSPTVQNNNPFIHGVDTTKQLTSGASFYTRQSGSTYDFGGNNVGDPAGLGGVALDDPTGDGGNPYLSNYVLGVETVNKEVKVINSTGELAYQAGANKSGTKIGAVESPYAQNDGLRYNTQRSDGTRGATETNYKYPNHAGTNRTHSNPAGFHITNTSNGNAPLEPDHDFAYDYSEVLIAPVRNNGWLPADDLDYKNETWTIWTNGVQYGRQNNGCRPNPRGGCTDTYITLKRHIEGTDKKETKGDFDPWRNDAQDLTGEHNDWGTNWAGCPLNQDCDKVDVEFRNRVILNANGEYKVTKQATNSARWAGDRVYRRQAGESGSVARANNLVDDEELPIRMSSSTIDYYPSKDEDGNMFDPIENTTINLRANLPTINQDESYNANLEEAFGRKVYTIQEVNKRKVHVAEEAITNAKDFAKATSDTAVTALGNGVLLNILNGAGGTSNVPFINVNLLNGTTLRIKDTEAEYVIKKDNHVYDSGLIVYTPASKLVKGEGKNYGYRVPVFGLEENVYKVDETDGTLKVLNHIYDEDKNLATGDENIFFSLAKERRMVYNQPCGNGDVGTCPEYERQGADWADGVSVATGRQGGHANNTNAWDELLDFDNRDYNNIDGLDGRNNGNYVGEDGFNRTSLNSILGVDGDTWKRMQPWQRLTILREKRIDETANKVANNLETRVYGKNYRDLEAGAEGFQDTNNSYVGKLKAVKNEKGEVTAHKMANISPTALHHVQYGRLTNNIDILKDNELKGDKKRIIYRQFQEHGAANSVDTYFYRGTNRTTMEQMDALKARGGVIQYYGHALTYNLGPKVQTKDNTLPTAYGSSQESTIGNFVQAKFDTAQGKVDGSIYNFINKDVSNKPEDFFRQDLVTFQGDVYGNTVTGTATKLGIKPEQGTLTASFYGTAANELGGAVNSLTREQGYGEPKWGAVFGATRGTMVEQFNVIETNNTQP